jgi:hypothetical protein
MLAAIAALPKGVARPHMARDLVAAFDRPKFDSPAELEASLRAYFKV